jgi:hypothetical protein
MECKVGWREDQFDTYLVNKRNEPIGNYMRHDSGITQWICKQQKKLNCTANECKDNVFIPLKKKTLEAK